MTPRFVGHLDFAPIDYRYPELWQLEQPFGQVTSDGYIIICRPWKRTDGASIPRILWRALGHPFEGGNKFWSQPHDQGYNDSGVVLRLSDFNLVTPDNMLYGCGKGIYVYDAFATERVIMPRKWFDAKMVEAMKLVYEPAWKRSVAWAGVRAGGWKPWREVRK